MKAGDEVRFQIGDRVVAIVNHPSDNPFIKTGTTGTVAELRQTDIGVKWDVAPDKVHFHNLWGVLNECCGWYVYDSELDFFDDIEIEQPDGDVFADLLR